MKQIADIHCPQCGAPASFDIVEQRYLCDYCGGKVGIAEAQRQKQGYRTVQAGKIQSSMAQYKLYSASCTGCAATVVFEENEALASCAFCGRNLVRKEYLRSKNMPESVIPFSLTAEEAADRMRDWCDQNKSKPEAKHLLPLIGELKGFYLPYELVRGPVHMRVGRMDGTRSYDCEGFLDGEFVNRSKQLDNLLLDGMEPFNKDGMVEFDFAYVAGQRVKVPDVDEKTLVGRAEEEAAASYTPAVRRTLETRAVEIDANLDSAIRLPVLLPVYYLCKGDLMAAVNGQTGKVSVRAEKDSHYYFLPWWLKAIVSTVVLCGGLFAALRLFGMELGTSLILTGAMALVFIIITLCLFSDTTRNSFAVESGREIYTSGGKSFRRERGKLVLSDELLERKAAEPVFMASVDGQQRPVQMRFTTPTRVLRMVALSLGMLFLPVILALLINGFDFSRLELGGSAVWFCIFVPV
ncbi:MAG: zinc ribbon domain-containing protein, partial [Coriobacteriales bacterium]|nr:zinc ribbon domain-containing protein [Coriobacteriales bacterium]